MSGRPPSTASNRRGGYPNTPLAIDFEQMFDSGTTFAEGTSVTVGPDPMESLALPNKVYQSAKVALDDARAAGRRFNARRLDVRRRVFNAWLDYALLAERQRIARGNLALLKLITETAAARVRAGAQQQDLLRAEVASRTAENELRNLDAALPQTRAMLNAMMARARRPVAAPRPAARCAIPRRRRRGIAGDGGREQPRTGGARP